MTQAEISCIPTSFTLLHSSLSYNSTGDRMKRTLTLNNYIYLWVLTWKYSDNIRTQLNIIYNKEHFHDIVMQKC